MRRLTLLPCGTRTWQLTQAGMVALPPCCPPVRFVFVWRLLDAVELIAGWQFRQKSPFAVPRPVSLVLILKSVPLVAPATVYGHALFAPARMNRTAEPCGPCTTGAAASCVWQSMQSMVCVPAAVLHGGSSCVAFRFFGAGEFV